MKRIKKTFCLLAAIIFAFSAASCSDTDAKADSVVMTDSSGVIVREYTTNNQTFYAQGKISNALEGTKIRFVWSYTTDDQMIDQFEYSAKQSSEVIPATLTTNGDFPAGDYKLELFVGNRKKPDASVSFEVKQISSYIAFALLTDSIDENGKPGREIDTVEPTGKWFASAYIVDTQPNTIVHFVWLDSNGEKIDENTVDPDGKSYTYIFAVHSLSSAAPGGTYSVEIYIDDRTTPETTVSFEVEDVDRQRNEAENADYSVYVQTKGGFMINYPTAWTCLPFPDSLSAMFYPKEYVIDGEDEFNSVYVYKIDDLGFTTQEALDGWILATENENRENYEPLQSSIEQVNGRDMALFTYAWSRNGYDLVTSDFLIVDGEDLYVISSVATDEVLEDMYHYVEQMVLSFEIL